MNRRQFTLGLGAIAAAPSAPLAAVLPQSGASSAVLGHFKLAKLIARSHNRCSNEMLMRHLKVGPKMAAEVQSLLLERGVISTPSLAGVSSAVNPMNLNCVPQQVAYKPDLATQAADVRKRVQKIMQDRLEKAQEQDEPSDAEPLTNDAPED
jgi:hypothetical protein